MDEEFEYYINLYYKNEKKDSFKKYDPTKCEACSTDLLFDSYYYVCPECGIGYPYSTPSYRFCRSSPPYKRKWHFMTTIRKLNFCISGNELERMLETYVKLDHLYTKKYPKSNMVNIMFTIKFIAYFLNYTHISDKIKINKSTQTVTKWQQKLNLVLHK